MHESIHDKAYKYLFSNPMMLKELLETFVAMDWVKYIDFTKAQTIDKSYVNDEFKEYEADIIYKLQLKDSEIYLYLLLEFQSTVDTFIAFRMLQYVMELYRELIYKQKLKKLPVVFPLLLYNGDRKWTAPISFEGLIDVPDKLQQLKGYIPCFRYYPVIVNELSLEELESMMNAISTVFLCEVGDKDIFLKTVDRIKELMHIYRDKEHIIGTLIQWLLYYLHTHGKVEEAAHVLTKLETPKEEHSMLYKTIQQLKDDWKKEGIQIGIQQGIQKVIKKIQKSLFSDFYFKSDFLFV